MGWGNNWVKGGFLNIKRESKILKIFDSWPEGGEGDGRLGKILLLCSSYGLAMILNEYPEASDKTRPGERHCIYIPNDPHCPWHYHVINQYHVVHQQSNPNLSRCFEKHLHQHMGTYTGLGTIPPWTEGARWQAVIPIETTWLHPDSTKLCPLPAIIHKSLPDRCSWGAQGKIFFPSGSKVKELVLLTS